MKWKIWFSLKFIGGSLEGTATTDDAKHAIVAAGQALRSGQRCGGRSERRPLASAALPEARLNARSPVQCPLVSWHASALLEHGGREGPDACTCSCGARRSGLIPFHNRKAHSPIKRTRMARQAAWARAQRISVMRPPCRSSRRGTCG